MKFENNDDPWQWWQVGRLRSYMKKRMIPITPQVALRRKERLSIMYCVVAYMMVHYQLYRLGYLKPKTDPVDSALDTMDEGKIYSFKNFKLVKVQDFDSSEYDDVPEYDVPRKRKYQAL